MSSFFRSNTAKPITKFSFGSKQVVTGNSCVSNDLTLVGQENMIFNKDDLNDMVFNEAMMSTPKKVLEVINDSTTIEVTEELYNSKVEEEDELMITEVRQVGIGQEEEKANEEECFKNADFDSDAIMSQLPSDYNSSRTSDGNDKSDTMSMDFLLNALKSMSQAKESLEFKLKKTKLENNDIKKELNIKTESLNKVKGKTLKLIEEVQGNQEEVAILKTKMKENCKTTKQLNHDLWKVKDSSIKNNEIVNVLKGMITGYKDQFAINESTNLRKTQQIDYLKKRLDHLSGRLSEEKIKNSSIEKALEQTRESHETQFKVELEKHRQMLINLTDTNAILGDKTNLLSTTIADSLKDGLSINSEKMTDLKNQLSEKLIQISSQFMKSKLEQDELLNGISNEIKVSKKELAQELAVATSSVDMNLAQIFNTKFQDMGVNLKEMATIGDVAHIGNIIENFHSGVKEVLKLSGIIEKEKSKIEKELLGVKSEFDNTKKEINRNKKTISDLNKNLDYLKQQDLVKEKNILEFTNEIQSMKTKMDNTILELAIEKKQALISLEIQLTEKDKVFEILEKENVEKVKALAQQKSNYEKSVEDTYVEIASLKNKVSDLDVKLTKSNEFAQSKILELNSIKKEMSMQEQEYSKEVEKLKSNKYSIRDAKVEGNKQKTQITQLAKENATLKKSVKDQKMKIEKNELTLKELNQMNHLLETSLNESTSNLSELTDKNCEVEEEVSKLNKLMGLLQDELKEKETQISKLTSQRNQLATKEADVKTLAEEKPKTSTSMQESIQKSREKLSQIKPDKTRVQKGLSLRKRKLIDSQSQQCDNHSKNIGMYSKQKKTQPMAVKKPKLNDKLEVFFELPDFFDDMDPLESQKSTYKSHNK